MPKEYKGPIRFDWAGNNTKLEFAHKRLLEQKKLAENEGRDFEITEESIKEEYVKLHGNVIEIPKDEVKE